MNKPVRKGTKARKRKAKGTVAARAKGRTKGRSSRAVSQDYERKAKAPGKRTSKSGKTYYESRVNRSDAKRKRI